MQKAKAIIIASEGLTTNLLVEKVSAHMTVSCIFIETSESKKTILKRRLKRIGFFKTFGQVLFLVFALPFVSNGKKRISQILKQHKLKGKAFDSNLIRPINSVHDSELIKEIEKEKPNIIFILLLY